MNIYLLLFINVCGAQCNENVHWQCGKRVICTSCQLQVGECSAKKMNKNGFSIGIVNTDEKVSEEDDARVLLILYGAMWREDRSTE